MLPIILTVINDDDGDFVEKIYIEYEHQLYLIAMKYLHDHEEAQDCVHEVVATLIYSIDKFKLARDKGYLDKLIPVVGRNCALNALRIKRRRNKYEQPLAVFDYEEGEYVEMEIPDYSSSVEEIYISEENCDNLHKLVNKLDEKYRDIVILKSMGAETKMIAQIMNISEALVRKRYSRARAQLLKMGGKDLYV